MSPWLQVADKQASCHSHSRVIRNKRKFSISHTERGETSKWIVHSTCMELNERAHVFRRMYHFHRPVTFSKQFCVCSLTSHVIGQSVLEKDAIYLMLVMECTCQWGCIGTQAYHQCFIHFLMWNDQDHKIYSPSESPSRTFSMCLIMASRSLSCDTHEGDMFRLWCMLEDAWNTSYVPSDLLTETL